MNDKPKLSIIIPTYNEEKDISLLLKCLEDQRLKNFEVIFVDGCSSDKTIDVLKEFKIQSKLEIKIYSDIRFDRNRARNFGIKKSKNEILIILNADVFLTNNFTYFISEFYSWTFFSSSKYRSHHNCIGTCSNSFSYIARKFYSSI